MSSTLRPDGLRREDRASASSPREHFSPSFEHTASIGLLEDEIELEGAARASSPALHEALDASEAWCAPGVHRV